MGRPGWGNVEQRDGGGRPRSGALAVLIALSLGGLAESSALAQAVGRPALAGSGRTLEPAGSRPVQLAQAPGAPAGTQDVPPPPPGTALPLNPPPTAPGPLESGPMAPDTTIVPVFPVPTPPPTAPLLVVPESETAPGDVGAPGRVIRPEGAAPEPRGEEPQPLDDAGGDILDGAIETQGELSVIVGRSKVFRLKRPITRALVDNPNVADIQLLDAERPEPRLVNLYGRSFGRATVTFWDDQDRPSAYEVFVTIEAPELERKIGEVIPGADVRVRQVAQQVILEGQVADIQMMNQVLELVQSELRLTGQASVGSLAGAVGVGSGGGLQGAGGGTTVAYQGGQGQSPLSVANTANAQPGLVIVNRVRVPGPRQVLLKVKIAELNRTAMRQLGVSWLDTRNNAMLGSTIGEAATFAASGGSSQAAAFSPAALVPGALTAPIPSRIISAGFAPVASTFNAAASAGPNANAQLFGIFNAGEFNLFLNALRVNSLAKIMAEPNLMALDGQPAAFQAGGKFPYPVPQGLGNLSIEFANFGAILQFIPNIMPDGVIRLDVAPTFSELNFAAGFAIPGAGVVPGINERSARTVVELREGQTLAIAGLLSTRTNATTARIPGLGDIPIVGPWFSRNQIETLETELVVLVTPQLVEPMDAPEVPPAPGDHVLEPNDWEFYFLGRIEGKTGHIERATIEYQDPLNVMKHLRSEGHWVVGPHGHAD